MFEEGDPIKANPLAWWEFKDCMEYLERSGLERHPLHDQVHNHSGLLPALAEHPARDTSVSLRPSSGGNHGQHASWRCPAHLADSPSCPPGAGVPQHRRPALHRAGAGGEVV